MTKREKEDLLKKVGELQAEVVALKGRVIALEARPWWPYVPLAQPVNPFPYQPDYPQPFVTPPVRWTFSSNQPPPKGIQ